MSTTLSPENSLLQLDLPDPTRDDLSSVDFLTQLEKAWSICERVDLQTEIWRGRILRTVRDREKRGGEGRGAGFLQWLRDMEISKTRAYQLIQLADSADDLVGGGVLEEKSVNQFSRRAFIETAQSSPEVQQMISEAANEGQEITRRQVKRLADEFTSVTSPLIPEEIREKTQANLLPSRMVAPLVKELMKLPELQQADMKEKLRESPEVECIKEVTSSARWIGKSLEASLSLKSFQEAELNLEKAIQEAQRLDALGLLSDACGQARSIEASVAKLFLSWKRLGDLYERLWIESGSSTPYLRQVLESLQVITGSTIRVSLGELAGGKKLRLQIVEEDPESIPPPYD
ncbi:hypothetical protein [Prochlorococcus sp. MIT 1223]|uniref:hypothetical protein n=1 Tax=Prochlorococcus sp. MIT 1223 TaxID=3096217 RepID=UPI002A7588B1|nr:hypothetical protein [Prochlorococcus sp. MIT 1223]